MGYDEMKWDSSVGVVWFDEMKLGGIGWEKMLW